MIYRLIHSDVIDGLCSLPDASIDAVVTDPPYELGFMGRAWDSTGIANSVEMWREALRVLKPGGHLLSFGGTRTYHRMACAIEDAGFEIRDQIQWLYGSGFPKSKNLSGEWQGWGTALKPANEPCVLARKPLVGTVAANVLKFGTGALNIDGCRIPAEPREPVTGRGALPCRNSEHEPRAAGHVSQPHDGGRWPANVIFDEEAAAMLDDQTGELTSGKAPDSGFVRNADKFRNTYASFAGNREEPTALYGDTGGASRFFYIAKADRAERDEGIHDLEERTFGKWSSGDQNVGAFQSANTKRTARNHHPTVKPVDLMRYLVRLVTPPGGTVLDPFTGSGSTGMAAIAEGFDFIGIEREAEYIEIARRRIASVAPMFAKEIAS